MSANETSIPATGEPSLQLLSQLVGSWTTEATHPAVPGIVVRGSADVEWLEGQRFLISRTRTDHPDVPDAISIIGFTDRDRVHGAPVSTAEGNRLSMHYFDSRGVSRVFDVSIDSHEWRFWRDAAGFSQRFTGTITDGGDTIVGRTQLCQDDVHWNDDLAITYRRRRV